MPREVCRAGEPESAGPEVGRSVSVLEAWLACAGYSARIESIRMGGAVRVVYTVSRATSGPISYITADGRITGISR